MGKRYIVYKHTTPSEKVYVGITTQSVSQRIRGGYRHNIYFRNAMEKYGWDKIKTEILADSVTAEEATLLETYYIATFDAKDHTKGYNIDDGGVQKNSFSDETRKKISEAAKRRHTPISDETKKKLSRKARKKAVRNVDTGEVYESITAAGRATYQTYKHISEVCRGKRKTAGGYRWEFIDGSTDAVH